MRALFGLARGDAWVQMFENSPIESSMPLENITGMDTCG